MAGNAQNFIIPLTSDLDVKSNDMFVPADAPKFLHNRQQYQGGVLTNSYRFEHNGWAVGDYVVQFDIDTQGLRLPVINPAHELLAFKNIRGYWDCSFENKMEEEADFDFEVLQFKWQDKDEWVVNEDNITMSVNLSILTDGKTTTAADFTSLPFASNTSATITSVFDWSTGAASYSSSNENISVVGAFDMDALEYTFVLYDLTTETDIALELFYDSKVVCQNYYDDFRREIYGTYSLVDYDGKNYTFDNGITVNGVPNGTRSTIGFKTDRLNYTAATFSDEGTYGKDIVAVMERTDKTSPQIMSYENTIVTSIALKMFVWDVFYDTMKTVNIGSNDYITQACSSRCSLNKFATDIRVTSCSIGVPCNSAFARNIDEGIQVRALPAGTYAPFVADTRVTQALIVKMNLPIWLGLASDSIRSTNAVARYSASQLNDRPNYVGASVKFSVEYCGAGNIYVPSKNGYGNMSGSFTDMISTLFNSAYVIDLYWANQASITQASIASSIGASGSESWCRRLAEVANFSSISNAGQGVAVDFWWNGIQMWHENFIASQSASLRPCEFVNNLVLPVLYVPGYYNEHVVNCAWWTIRNVLGYNIPVNFANDSYGCSTSSFIKVMFDPTAVGNNRDEYVDYTQAALDQYVAKVWSAASSDTGTFYHLYQGLLAMVEDRQSFTGSLIGSYNVFEDKYRTFNASAEFSSLVGVDAWVPLEFNTFRNLNVSANGVTLGSDAEEVLDDNTGATLMFNKKLPAPSVTYDTKTGEITVLRDIEGYGAYRYYLGDVPAAEETLLISKAYAADSKPLFTSYGQVFSVMLCNPNLEGESRGNFLNSDIVSVVFKHLIDTSYIKLEREVIGSEESEEPEEPEEPDEDKGKDKNKDKGEDKGEGEATEPEKPEKPEPTDVNITISTDYTPATNFKLVWLVKYYVWEMQQAVDSETDGPKVIKVAVEKTEYFTTSTASFTACYDKPVSVQLIELRTSIYDYTVFYSATNFVTYNNINRGKPTIASESPAFEAGYNTVTKHQSFSHTLVAPSINSKYGDTLSDIDLVASNFLQPMCTGVLYSLDGCLYYYGYTDYGNGTVLGNTVSCKVGDTITFHFSAVSVLDENNNAANIKINDLKYSYKVKGAPTATISNFVLRVPFCGDAICPVAYNIDNVAYSAGSGYYINDKKFDSGVSAIGLSAAISATGKGIRYTTTFDVVNQFDSENMKSTMLRIVDPGNFAAYKASHEDEILGTCTYTYVDVDGNESSPIKATLYWRDANVSYKIDDMEVLGSRSAGFGTFSGTFKDVCQQLTDYFNAYFYRTFKEVVWSTDTEFCIKGFAQVVGALYYDTQKICRLYVPGYSDSADAPPNYSLAGNFADNALIRGMLNVDAGYLDASRNFIYGMCVVQNSSNYDDIDNITAYIVPCSNYRTGGNVGGTSTGISIPLFDRRYSDSGVEETWTSTSMAAVIPKTYHSGNANDMKTQDGIVLFELAHSYDELPRDLTAIVAITADVDMIYYESSYEKSLSLKDYYDKADFYNNPVAAEIQELSFMLTTRDPRYTPELFKVELPYTENGIAKTFVFASPVLSVNGVPSQPFQDWTVFKGTDYYSGNDDLLNFKFDCKTGSNYSAFTMNNTYLHITSGGITLAIDFEERQSASLEIIFLKDLAMRFKFYFPFITFKKGNDGLLADVTCDADSYSAITNIFKVKYNDVDYSINMFSASTTIVKNKNTLYFPEGMTVNIDTSAGVIDFEGKGYESTRFACRMHGIYNEDFVHNSTRRIASYSEASHQITYDGIAWSLAKAAEVSTMTMKLTDYTVNASNDEGGVNA